MQFAGKFTGWVSHHTKEPTYQNQPCDWSASINVTEDTEELVAELEKRWGEACSWWANQSGRGPKARFFPKPWIEETDGSVTVRIKARPGKKEFPFPFVDGNLEPLAEDINLREGTYALIESKCRFYSPQAKQGGMRVQPLGIQILKAVTAVAQDSGGEKDVTPEGMFEKRKGYKQASPKVEKPDNVADEDPDF